MNLDFRQWYINEVGTGTNCIAVFARPIGGPVTRTWPSLFGDDEKRKDDKENKHDKKN